MIAKLFTIVVFFGGYVTAGPVLISRAVTTLDQAAFEEAQQRDNTATRAFSNTQIKTSDGKCLTVDKLSGDFRANLTPIQVAGCGTADGQGWDVITNGKHNNVANSILVVSTSTGACFNFDPRRAAGNQVLLFSCGGRADGGGLVTPSQLFAFAGAARSVAFSPENQSNSCFTVKGNVLDIAPCAAGDPNQTFSFDGEPAVGVGLPVPAPSVVTTAKTVVPISPTPVASVTSIAANPITTAIATGGIPNPTGTVPVSRAGGVLQPSAVAESHPRDDTATRAFSSVSIKAPNGQCLFIDPTAGDFRENLIPISLAACAGTPNEKFDIITAGKHNNAQGAALLVSSLTQGCVSHDGRRAVDDTVTLFSCGGRANGEGLTNTGQLFRFAGGKDLIMSPLDAANTTCIVPGNGRLVSTGCSNDASQVFTIQV